MHVSLSSTPDKLALACATWEVGRRLSRLEAGALRGEVRRIRLGERSGGDVEDGRVGLATVAGLDSVDDCWERVPLSAPYRKRAAAALAERMSIRSCMKPDRDDWDAPSQCQYT